MTALVVGTLVALVALAFVLHPLFAHDGSASSPERAPSARGFGPPPAEDAVAALREIEFDRATGKLSDADYDELRARYTERALASMRASESAAALATLSPDDAVEAAVQRQRAALTECVTCGPRPELDAVYCSTCGHFLPGRCAGCGTAAEQPGQRFCTGCGKGLAA